MLDVEYKFGTLLDKKSDLNIFLTERYCLYLEKNNKLFRYEIHHLPWEIQKLELNKLTTNYFIGNQISLVKKPNLTLNYSHGIQVVAWNINWIN